MIKKENIMKTRFFIVALFFVGVTFLKAEETITIQANSYDISENLDLRAVADLFGRSESVEEFEINLNNSESQYSNLDLNEDGFVDYLRVVEERKNDTHFVILQAVLARDVYDQGGALRRYHGFLSPQAFGQPQQAERDKRQ